MKAKRQKVISKNEKLTQFIASDSMFYAWECVSLILSNNTTVDLVIKDRVQLMCLLHVLAHKVRHSSRGCLRAFKFLKAKMKISYECRQQQIETADLFYNALYKVLGDIRTLAVYKLQ